MSNFAFNNPAFVPVEKYADAGTLLNGEIGAVSQFRIVVVPEMMHWEAAGVVAHIAAVAVVLVDSSYSAAAEDTDGIVAVVADDIHRRTFFTVGRYLTCACAAPSRITFSINT